MVSNKKRKLRGNNKIIEKTQLCIDYTRETTSVIMPKA